MKFTIPHYTAQKTWIIIGVVVLIFIITLSTTRVYNLSQKIKFTEMEFASSTTAYETTLRELRDKISNNAKEYQNIVGLLDGEQKKTLDLSNDRERNQREIDKLFKLTSIDPELIKKYSKVYFLSENYTPAKLIDVNPIYTADPAKPVQFLDQAYVNLENLLKDTIGSNIPIKVLSGYRSFGYQKNLKAEYKITYGAGTANNFSAEQGYSEHQLGTAVDFTTPSIRGASFQFENTVAFKVLNTNAYKYGFIISYPKVNKFYQYEPWHWRYVGKELAKYLHDNNKYFYEMDQREIDAYLIKIFD